MKLVYFNARGLAETSRLLLAVNNVNYEDFRYPLKINDWATHDMEREEFLNDKKNNKLLDSLNKLPFLEIDGQVIPQSKSIERFIAKKYNMFGDNDLDAARIDRQLRRKVGRTRAAGRRTWRPTGVPVLVGR